MKVDVCIIGAGPAGIALAIRAKRSGFRVAIISPEGRAYRSALPETLPGAAKAHLQALNLFEDFEKALFPRHHAMVSVWGNEQPQERHSICNAAGAGWYIDRFAFDSWLLHAAGLSVISGHLRSASRSNSRWQLKVSNTDEPVEAAVVADASGRASAFAQRIGVKRRYIDRQVCTTKRFPVEATPEALVESAPQGWWFSAPRSDNEIALAFYTDADLLPSDVRSCARFSTLLKGAANTRARINEITQEPATTQVASSSYLQEFAGDGCFAVGDAAISYDPLASQGLLQAFESAEHAHQSILQSLNGLEHQAIETYQAYQESALSKFLLQRRYYYTAEHRWMDSPFWQRRNGRPQQPRGGDTPALWTINRIETGNPECPRGASRG